MPSLLPPPSLEPSIFCMGLGETHWVVFLIKGTSCSEEGYRSYLCNEDTKKSRYAGERTGLCCISPLDFKVTWPRKFPELYLVIFSNSMAPIIKLQPKAFMELLCEYRVVVKK